MRDGDLQLQRDAGDLHVGAQLRELLFHVFADGKIERDFAHVFALGHELLLPEHLVAIGHADLEGRPRGHVIFECDRAAHAVLEEDGVRSLRLDECKIARAHLAAEADGEDGHAARGKHLCDLGGRLAFVVLAVGEEDDCAALFLHLLADAGAQAGGEIGDAGGGFWKGGRQRGVALGRLPDLLRLGAVEVEELHVVGLAEFRQKLLLLAFEEHGLETLPARHGVEFVERGLERRTLGSGEIADAALKSLLHLGAPPPGDAAEPFEILACANAVVDRLRFAASQFARGCREFLGEEFDLPRLHAGLADEIARGVDLPGEVGRDFLPLLGGDALRVPAFLRERLGIGERFARVREFHLHSVGLEQAEALQDRDLAARIHRGIGEPHAGGAIDEEEQAGELADDLAVVQDRACEHQDHHHDGQRAECRKQPAEPKGEAARLAPIQRP